MHRQDKLILSMLLDICREFQRQDIQLQTISVIEEHCIPKLSICRSTSHICLHDLDTVGLIIIHLQLLPSSIIAL